MNKPATFTKKISGKEIASFLLIPLALMSALGIASADVFTPLSSKSQSNSPKRKEKLCYSNYLFDDAITTKKFGTDDSALLQNYANFESGCNIKSLTKSKEALLEEIDKGNQPYPLSRLALVSQYLQKPVADLKSVAKEPDAKDLSLALKVQTELSQGEATAKLTQAEIEAAFPDKMMQQAFIVKAKSSGNEERKVALEGLKTRCEKINSKIRAMVILDFVGCIIGFFCLITMWRERKEEQTMVSDDAPIAYPKARSIIYTIFSITLAMICSALVCWFAGSALKLILPEAVAKGVRAILFTPAWLFILYEFSVRQQKLSFLEGFRLRFPNTLSEGSKGFQIALMSFFIMCLFTAGVAAACVFFPSNIQDTSGTEDIFAAINSSMCIPMILSMTILGPIAEEALFRGYLYSALRKKMGCIAAALFSASLFALAHVQFNPYTVFHHFVLGIFAVYLFQRTRSIIPGIILHSLWNAFVVVNVFAPLTAVYPVERIFF